MKTGKDPRHQARILAIQYLFEKYFDPAEGERDIVVKDLMDMTGIKNYDEVLYEKLITGVTENLSEIDTIIAKYATSLPINQMKKTDLQALRVAIYEGFITDITPQKVAIDEAVELGKTFGGPASHKFINGVLGNLVKIDTKNDGPKD